MEFSRNNLFDFFTKDRFTLLNGTLCLLIISCVHILLNGYEFGMGDQVIQIPIIKKLINPSLYPNDYLFTTIDGYVSFFPLLMAKLVLLFNDMKLIYYTIYILSLLIFYRAIFGIANLVFNRQVGIISVLLMLFLNPSLGGSVIYFSRLFPAQVVMPLALYSIFLYLSGKKKLAFIILGIGFNLHVLVSAFACFIIGVHSVTNFLKENEKLKSIIIYLILFLLMSLPSILRIVQSHEEIDNLAETLRIFKIQGGHHSFPSTWELNTWLTYFLFLLAGILAYFKTPFKKKPTFFVVSFFSIASLCFVGILFTDFFPSINIIKAQFFRSTNYLTIFVLMTLANAIHFFWDKNFLNRIVVSCLFLTLFLPITINSLVISIVSLLFVGQKRFYFSIPKLRVSRIHIIVACVLFVVIPSSIFLIMPEVLNLVLDLSKRHYLRVFSLSLVVLVLFSLTAYSLKTRRNIVFLGIVLILFTFPMMYSVFHSNDRYNMDWIEAQLWVKENTSKDVKLLTPPTEIGFRVYSERAIVCELKDGTQQYFKNEFGFQWWEKVNRLNPEENPFKNKSESELINIGKDYGAKYLVFYNDKDLSLKQVFRNDTYVVYQF